MLYFPTEIEGGGSLLNFPAIFKIRIKNILLKFTNFIKVCRFTDMCQSGREGYNIFGQNLRLYNTSKSSTINQAQSPKCVVLLISSEYVEHGGRLSGHSY